MAATFPETARTRAAWALLWTTIRKPWKDAERTADLAEELGCARTAVSQWCSGTDARMGPWSLLYDTCRLTGEAFREQVPEILQALGKDLFGVECRVELKDAKPLGDLLTEIGQRDTAWGRVLEARASGSHARIRKAVESWLAECEDVGRVVELEAK